MHDAGGRADDDVAAGWDSRDDMTIDVHISRGEIVGEIHEIEIPGVIDGAFWNRSDGISPASRQDGCGDGDCDEAGGAHAHIARVASAVPAQRKRATIADLTG